MVTLDVSTVQTPIGPLTLVVADDLIRAAGFTDDVALLTERLASDLRGAASRSVGDLGPISNAVADYFAGELAALDALPVMQPGGPFQQRVWRALRAVAPGVQTTYGGLATTLGAERSARAVGMACATNQIAPIVPCHRITGSTGNLTGYYWGLDRKRWLLAHERRHRPAAGGRELVEAAAL